MNAYLAMASSKRPLSRKVKASTPKQTKQPSLLNEVDKLLYLYLGLIKDKSMTVALKWRCWFSSSLTSFTCIKKETSVHLKGFSCSSRFKSKRRQVGQVLWEVMWKIISTLRCSLYPITEKEVSRYWRGSKTTSLWKTTPIKIRFSRFSTSSRWSSRDIFITTYSWGRGKRFVIHGAFWWHKEALATPLKSFKIWHWKLRKTTQIKVDWGRK